MTGDPREQICAAVAGQLRKVLVERGYATDAGRHVYRVDLRAGQLGEESYPALFVLRESDVTEKLNDGGYKSLLTLSIAGLVSLGQTDITEDKLDSALNALVNDARKALLEVPRFGLGMNVTSWLGSVEDLIDTASGRGAFLMPFTVLYHFARVTL